MTNAPLLSPTWEVGMTVVATPSGVLASNGYSCGGLLYSRMFLLLFPGGGVFFARNDGAFNGAEFRHRILCASEEPAPSSVSSSHLT